MSTPAVPIPVAATGTTQVFVGPCTYRGFSLREAAGTAAVATVRIWDGTSASGTLLAVVELPANGSSSESVAGGLRAALGVFVEVVAGSVEGSVRIG